MSRRPLHTLLGLSTLVTALFLPQPAGEASSTAPDPTAIGKYPVHGLIGRGGEASVYLGEHPALGNDVVLKWAHDRDTGSRLRAEGRLLTRLDSTHIVRALDLDEHDDRPFLVLESVPGDSLAERVLRRPPTSLQSARWLATLARAVERVHGLGFIHQDINPANILIDDRGEPKLIDFGLSRPIAGDGPSHDASSEDDETGHPCGGTLAYMAPEQATQDAGSVGPATDVFGLGATLFYCLTGAPPYDTDTAQEAWERARTADFDGAALMENRVPERLREICARAMSEAPEARHASAGRFAEALEQWLES